MIRKMGGLVGTFSAGENIVDRCIAKIHEVDPESEADKLLYISIRGAENAHFVMDGYDFYTNEFGNFSSILLDNHYQPTIKDIRFDKEQTLMLSFVY